MTTFHKSADAHVRSLKKWTRNTDLESLQGTRLEAVDTELILRWLNEGKDQIQRAIANSYQNAFATFVDKQISSKAKEFAIPEEAIVGNRIISLSYGAAANDTEFYRIPFRPAEGWHYSEGQPSGYYVTSRNVVVWPVPASGYYRFIIQRRDDTLDVRRATIKSVVPSGGNLQALELEQDAILDQINKDALTDATYVCVNDFDGTVLAYNIPVDSFDIGTFQILVHGTYANPGTIAPGQYLTIGANTTTHSKLPYECQAYYVEWAHYRWLTWDSSEDAQQETPALQAIRESIVDTFGDNADIVIPALYGHYAGDWLGEGPY